MAAGHEVKVTPENGPPQTVDVLGQYGPQGPRGPVWREGSGPPDDTLGDNRDFYHNRDNGDVYQKLDGTYGAPYANITGPQGPQGIQGPQGDKGWSPVPSVVDDGERRVFRVDDWVGGAGTKPQTGLYLGPTGWVTDIADAVDIRGPQGIGVPDPTGKTAGLVIQTDGADGHEHVDYQTEIQRRTRLARSFGATGDRGQTLQDDFIRRVTATGPFDVGAQNLHEFDGFHTWGRQSAGWGWDIDANGVPIYREFAENEPIYTIDPATGERVGLRIERSGTTNLIEYAIDFTQWSRWTNATRSVLYTANFARAIDGTTTASRFNPPDDMTDPGSQSYATDIYYSAGSVSAGDWIMMTGFVKPIVATSLYVGNPDGADEERDVYYFLNSDVGGQTYFNLRTLTATAPDGDVAVMGMVPQYDGWYRCYVIFQATGDDNSANVFQGFSNRTTSNSFDPYPSGEEDAYFWGVHVSIGKHLPNFIPTHGTTVSRAEDNLRLDNLDWFSRKQGTFVLHGFASDKIDEGGDAGGLGILGGEDASGNRDLYLFLDKRGFVEFGDSDVDTSNRIEPGERVSIGVSWNQEGTILAVSGNRNTVAREDGPPSTDAVMFHIFADRGSIAPNDGELGAIVFYPFKLTQEQLEKEVK